VRYLRPSHHSIPNRAMSLWGYPWGRGPTVRALGTYGWPTTRDGSSQCVRWCPERPTLTEGRVTHHRVPKLTQHLSEVFHLVPSSLPHRETRAYPSICGEEVGRARVAYTSGVQGFREFRGERKGKSAPPESPPPKVLTRKLRARVLEFSRDFHERACAPSLSHSGHVGHPTVGVALGRICGVAWRVWGNTTGFRVSTRVVAETPPRGWGIQQTFLPPQCSWRDVETMSGWVGARAHAAYRPCVPFGHREVGVWGGRRCGQPHIPLSSPKARVVKCAPPPKFHPIS
jgi:hypothetical protein